MWRRAMALVEGQTEEAFFNRVIRPHLAEVRIDASCTMICTSRESGRREHRGGHAHRWDLVERDIRLLLKSKFDAVTTMHDVYGFPRDMPGFPDPWPDRTSDRVDALNLALSNAVGDSRFVPGLLVHEFEAVLFTSTTTIVTTCVRGEARQAKASRDLETIRQSFQTPEDINDRVDTAPSKRIEAAVPEYVKPRHGPVIAQTIGLAAMPGS